MESLRMLSHVKLHANHQNAHFLLEALAIVRRLAYGLWLINRSASLIDPSVLKSSCELGP